MRNIKLFFLCLPLLIATSLFSQSDVVNIPFEDAGAAKKLKIHIPQGNIKIIGSDRQDILVRYHVTNEEEEETDRENEGKNKGLKRIAGSNLNLEMACQNNIAEITSSNWHRYLILDIEVPRNITLDIQKNIGDTIWIENISGNLNIENNVGDIIAKRISGLVNASTNAGSILVEFDKITSDKTMRLLSTTGQIDVSLPANHAANLKLKTDMGEIYSDLDISLQKSNIQSDTKNNNGDFSYFNDSWTSALLNGGGPEIALKTKLGNIYLRKK